jgi:hypothetical protein
VANEPIVRLHATVRTGLIVLIEIANRGTLVLTAMATFVMTATAFAIIVRNSTVGVAIVSPYVKNVEMHSRCDLVF